MYILLLHLINMFRSIECLVFRGSISIYAQYVEVPIFRLYKIISIFLILTLFLLFLITDDNYSEQTSNNEKC